ncbi:MAG: hypothetical protein U9O98_11400, partial [Asgard group archaeon]|nr:hypothetical protein [Asgard group archaeon]
MCHLAGYIGQKNGIQKILESLHLQEAIIGGQATGLAFFNKNNLILKKTVGPLKNFLKTFPTDTFKAKISIGHTRYALKNLSKKYTNTPAKAHPFWGSTKELVTMHNGTISNVEKFIEQLEYIGYHFSSKTIQFDPEEQEEKRDICDSEIFPYLVEEALKETNNIKEAIKTACKDIEGHFAFVLLHKDYPESIFIANWRQPLHIAYNSKSCFFSSFPEGLEPIKEKMPCSINNLFNSLIELRKEEIRIERLLQNRTIPNFGIKKQPLREALYQAIRNEKTTVGTIWK